MKKYFKCTGDERFNNVVVDIEYWKDDRPRGYYLWAYPALVYDGGFKWEPFEKQKKQLLKEVSRKSDKAYQEACQIAEGIEKQLVDELCEEIGVTLDVSQET